MKVTFDVANSGKLPSPPGQPKTYTFELRPVEDDPENQKLFPNGIGPGSILLTCSGVNVVPHGHGRRVTLDLSGVRADGQPSNERKGPQTAPAAPQGGQQAPQPQPAPTGQQGGTPPAAPAGQ